MAWTARTESRKDRGSVNIGNIGGTEDAARRRFAAVATPAVPYHRPPAAARLAGDIDQSSRYGAADLLRDRIPRRLRRRRARELRPAGAGRGAARVRQRPRTDGRDA